ncbi:MerR family transcriptional regulator [Nocardia flavorosea]|uniref:MerR family transcriptional regulator n=1 Tax=Nocardia flavorosea TaxID=53429 RepID=A0A846YHR4_9NOCA|nr:MerR family transcriptional regulator [Nocardia flavorosea]NKY57240.1 MerR family transcriptional regulator [Nocardia flavorosea]
MSGITSGAVGIGEASRRTGVPVRTIRFYCDVGILATQRTSGGHRMFISDALDRLVLVRELRVVGLGLAAIADVLAGVRAVPEAVAVERAAVEDDLAALSWRYAVLVAIEQADDPLVFTELAAVAERGAARTVLIDFWRRILAAMPASMFDGFVEMDIPRAPPVPSPGHVIRFAELGQLARSPELVRVVSRQIWGAGEWAIRNRRAFLADLAPAHTAAAERMIADDPPEPGSELDLYVAAHATARGRRDTGGFRCELARGVTITDRTAARYWVLTAEALDTPYTTGGVQKWLDTALLRSLEPSHG